LISENILFALQFVNVKGLVCGNLEVNLYQAVVLKSLIR